MGGMSRRDALRAMGAMAASLGALTIKGTISG